MQPVVGHPHVLKDMTDVCEDHTGKKMSLEDMTCSSNWTEVHFDPVVDLFNVVKSYKAKQNIAVCSHISIFVISLFFIKYSAVQLT